MSTSSPLAGSFDPADRIVVPVQGAASEFLAQSWAVEFAAALGVPVHGVHVATRDEERTGEDGESAFEYLQRECKKWGVKFDHVVLHGEPVHEILQELRPRDLVVVGTRRMAGKYHVGSVAAELVRVAPCPVQIVRLT